MAAILVIGGALAWIGGELHYRNCLRSVEAKADAGAFRDYADRVADAFGRQAGRGDYSAEIEGCSRLPF